jgi:hypothetical protein
VEEDADLEGEIWAKVPESYGGNNVYVSSLGRKRSYFGVVATATPNKEGYVQVKIGDKSFLLHRVILEAFGVVRPSPAHEFANRKDLDRSNNRLDNLEWCTREANIRHSYANNSDRKSNGPKQAKPLRGKRDEEEWVEYASANEAARNLGFNPGIIFAACNEGRTPGGYTFEYSEPNEPGVVAGDERVAYAGLRNFDTSYCSRRCKFRVCIADLVSRVHEVSHATRLGETAGREHGEDLACERERIATVLAAFRFHCLEIAGKSVRGGESDTRARANRSARSGARPNR